MAQRGLAIGRAAAGSNWQRFGTLQQDALFEERLMLGITSI
jgi:hypothetical protein